MPPPEATDPVRRLYDTEAAGYDQRWSYYTYATLTSALDHLTELGEARVLDVACGTGELPRLMLAQCPSVRVVGMDLSPEMLGRATAKLGGNPAVALLRGSAVHLPFADAAFDVLVNTNAFHYFPDPAAACTEMYRVLRPGGRVVVVDWCHDYWTCKLCQWYLRMTDPAHHRMYTLRECDGRLTAAGFQTVAQRRFKVSLLWGLMVVVAVKRGAGG